jgi:ribosomal protein S20
MDTLQTVSSVCDSAAKKGIETENNGNGMLEDIIHANDQDRFHNSRYKWAIKAWLKSVHRAILFLLKNNTW